MPSVLVLNSGSSSLKYQLLDVAAGTALARGQVARIGEPEAALTHDGRSLDSSGIQGHDDALARVFDAFAEHGPDLAGADLVAVGHRVVHGGERSAPALVDDALVAEIEGLARLAPLHNPPAVLGITAARRLLPEVAHVAVFDTAFFATLPPAARTYAVDAETAGRLGIRRYGFHGTSHDLVSQRTAELLGRPRTGLRQIVLHLGNGASASAIDGDTPLDTSMGMTPLEGLVMGTRSGDLDPGAVLALVRELGVEAADRLLNARSGLAGLAGVNDFRELLTRVDAGDEAAGAALEVYLHRLVRYVGAYHALLGGVEALVFTAGVGENNPRLRAELCRRLAPLGFALDEAANQSPDRGARVISTPDSPVTLAVVPTDEELAIARQAAALV